MMRGLTLVLLFGIAVFGAVVLTFAHKAAHEAMEQAAYGEQMNYFCMDGNTIDFGYEGVRWHHIMVYDVNNFIIWDFTKANNQSPEAP